MCVQVKAALCCRSCGLWFLWFTGKKRTESHQAPLVKSQNKNMKQNKLWVWCRLSVCGKSTCT